MSAGVGTWRSNLATVRSLVRRAMNELFRVPGAAIPGVLAPTIFFLGLTSAFGSLTDLRGFEGDEDGDAPGAVEG